MSVDGGPSEASRQHLAAWRAGAQTAGITDVQYDAICRVIDQVKTDDRNLDTNEYAGMIADALSGNDQPPLDLNPSSIEEQIARAQADVLNRAATAIADLRPRVILVLTSREARKRDVALWEAQKVVQVMVNEIEKRA